MLVNKLSKVLKESFKSGHGYVGLKRTSSDLNRSNLSLHQAKLSKSLSEQLNHSFKRVSNVNWEDRIRSTYYPLAISTIVFAVGYECTVRRDHLESDWVQFKKTFNPPFWDRPVNTFGSVFYDEPERVLFRPLRDRCMSWIDRHHSQRCPTLIVLSGKPGAGKYTTAYDVLLDQYNKSLIGDQNPPTFFMIDCKSPQRIRKSLIRVAKYLRISREDVPENSCLSSLEWQNFIDKIKCQLDRRKGKNLVILRCVRDAKMFDQLYQSLPQTSQSIIIATAGNQMVNRIQTRYGSRVSKTLSVSNSVAIESLKAFLPGVGCYEIRRLNQLLDSEPRCLVQAVAVIKQECLTPLEYCYRLSGIMQAYHCTVEESVIIQSITSIQKQTQCSASQLKHVLQKWYLEDGLFKDGIAFDELGGVMGGVDAADRHGQEKRLNDLIQAFIEYGLMKFINNRLFPRILVTQKTGVLKAVEMLDKGLDKG